MPTIQATRDKLTALLKRAADLGKTADAEDLMVRVLDPFLAQFPEPRKQLTQAQREDILRMRGVLRPGESLADHQKAVAAKARAHEEGKAAAASAAAERIAAVKAKAKALRAANAKKK